MFNGDGAGVQEHQNYHKPEPGRSLSKNNNIMLKGRSHEITSRNKLSGRLLKAYCIKYSELIYSYFR